MQFFNKKDRLMLMELSKDSRLNVTKLSKLVGYSRITTIKGLDRLKKNLDIRFTLEINESELRGFERHIIAIKLSKRPKIGELKRLFAGDRYAQNVYLTEGDFDLLVYAASNSAVDYIAWETHIAEALVDYGAEILPSEYVTSHFGYMPLNENFIDTVVGAYRIDKKDRAILKLLNSNSRLGYRDISRQTGIPEDTVRYRLFLLKKSGVIKRFTIAVQRPPEDSVGMAYFINYVFSKDTTSRSFPAAKKHFLDSDRSEPVLNSFQLIAPISGRYRSFGITLFPSMEEAMKNTVDMQKKIFKEEKIELGHAVIKMVLKGLLPFRRLDIRENYKAIEWRDG